MLCTTGMTERQGCQSKVAPDTVPFRSLAAEMRLAVSVNSSQVAGILVIPAALNMLFRQSRLHRSRSIGQSYILPLIRPSCCTDAGMSFRTLAGIYGSQG